MPTEWMKNLEKDLQSITESEIKEAEPPDDYPEVEKGVVGVLGNEICRIITLKNRYRKQAVSIDKELEKLEQKGEGEKPAAKKIKGQLRMLALNLEILEGMFSASIYVAFPELMEKAGVIVARGWKVIAVDARIVIATVPHHSTPSTNNN